MWQHENKHWVAFSTLDNELLEAAAASEQGIATQTMALTLMALLPAVLGLMLSTGVVVTDGNRCEVDLALRRRVPAYWQAEPNPVVR